MRRAVAALRAAARAALDAARAHRVRAAIGALLVLAGVAAALVVVLSSGEAPRHPPTTPAPPTTAPPTTAPTTPPPRPPSQPPALPAPKGATAYGVSVNTIFNGSAFDRREIDRQLQAVRDHCIRLARSDALWEVSEPKPPVAGRHRYDWSFDDRVAGALARHGIRWWPIIDYTPTWASSVPGDTKAPPRDVADYGAFARAFAARYGAGGAFWRAHPELPALPVASYEIWNEENSPIFFKPAPDPGVYGRMYLAARAAIKQVDPRARVLVGGLAAAGTDFIAPLYAAVPALRGHVDGVAIHPYGRSVADVIADVRKRRAALDRADGRGVPMPVTELGWQTSPASAPNFASQSQRAKNLVFAAGALGRSTCNIPAVIFYTWTVPDPDPNVPDDSYGIYGAGGAETPASRALRRFLGSGAAKGEQRLDLCGR